MHRFRTSIQLGLGLLTLSLMLLSHNLFQASTPSLCIPALTNAKTLQYHSLHIPNGVLHYVVVPKDSPYRVVPAFSATLQTVEGFAKEYKSPFVINGGYFDPKNGKTTSFITLSGHSVGDPRHNERLMENPDLKPLMAQILDRSEFRVYTCPEGLRYDITRHSTPIPKGCNLQDSLGAGPDLTTDGQALQEAFISYRDTKLVRDPLGVNQLNARSALGLTPTGSIILGMVAQLPEKPLHSGVTLEQLQALMRSLGARKMMALDGGSSSSMVVEGKALYGKVNKDGSPVRRSVKSVLLLQRKAP